MEEYKVGDEITLVVKKNALENPLHPCEGCFFLDTPIFGSCYPMCEGRLRSDHKNVIYIEKGK